MRYGRCKKQLVLNDNIKNYRGSLVIETCHGACIFEVKNDLIIFDVEKYILNCDSKHACITADFV